MTYNPPSMYQANPTGGGHDGVKLLERSFFILVQVLHLQCKTKQKMFEVVTFV